MHKELLDWIDQNTLLLLGCFFVGFFILGQVLYWYKVSIWRVVILSGTFALAMAFAGNDLVNFIGGTCSCLGFFPAVGSRGNSRAVHDHGSPQGECTDPSDLSHHSRDSDDTYHWFSKKAHQCDATEMKLSQQGGGKERFEATGLSRGIVRFSVWVTSMIEALIPKRTLKYYS